MIRIHNMLLAAALASSIALPCAAESLSLADLADAQDAQMIDMGRAGRRVDISHPIRSADDQRLYRADQQGKPAG